MTMINPLKSISVTNCLNIWLMINIILPWILLPFPFSLNISRNNHRKTFFVSDIRDLQNYVIKLKLCSPQKSNLLRFQILWGESHILSQTAENGQSLTMFYQFKIWEAFTLKSISDSNQVKHCQTKIKKHMHMKRQLSINVYGRK